MKYDFETAVAAARRWKGWTLEEIAAGLGVSVHAVRSWLKPASLSSRAAPSWAGYALTALALDQPVTERRGALRVTYEPATKTPDSRGSK